MTASDSTDDGATDPATVRTVSDDEANRALAADLHLGPLVEAHGPASLEPADDFFERFVQSIVRQQVSMASAGAIEERLVDAVDLTPRAIINADEATLRDAGLSQAKTDYVRNIARAFESGEISRERLAGMDDEAVRDELTDITGVGRWTADMQLMFSLGRPDVFPVGDLGIRRGMESLFGELSRAEMEERAERWVPYRSYASLYLWRATDGE